MKSFVDLPDYDELTSRCASNYGKNFDGFLTSRVLLDTHRLTETPEVSSRHFGRVVEVGAGQGTHLNFVKHSFDEYVMSDTSSEMYKAASKDHRPGVRFEEQNARQLTYENDSADRLIATHVLEHISDPHLVLEEWVRVVRPGGLLSLILPCDPGLAWRLGRYLGPRQRGLSAGLPYDYYMAREHVNSIFNLLNLIRYHFAVRKEYFWPLQFIKAPDINLIYAVNIEI